MVLQRAPEAARLFGWTKNPGERVSVYVGSSLKGEATSGSDKSWSATLPPYSAGGPYDIVVSSSGDSVTLTDVFFGDVWLCGGQSNMQFTVIQAFNSSVEIPEANNYPFIRLFTVGQDTISFTPLEQLATIEQGWSVASSKSVGGAAWSHFSAVCWFTGKYLYDRYKVPLGLISSNWGGTIIQAWSSPAALKQCNVTSSNPDNSSNNKGTLIKAPGADPNQNSVLYNAMIYPYRNMKIRGAYWYQGESNVGQAPYYTCAFPAMIEDWKNLINLANIQFTFFFVQLAPWVAAGNDQVALLRQAQLASLALPYVGYATAADLGDLGSPYGDIHPRDKETVGQRLSLATRYLAYGEKSLVWRGPFATSAKLVSAPPNAVVEVFFERESVGEGLVMRPSSCPASLPSNRCGWPAIQTSDGVWHNTTSTAITANTALFGTYLGTGATVKQVSFGFADWPLITIYNKEGLPANPFIFTI